MIDPHAIPAPHLHTHPAPLRRLRDLFAIDPRSLALFRIGVAGLIIVDLISRAGDLRAHYTDAGVLPRDDALHLYGWPTFRSLHWHLSQYPLAQSILFFMAGMAAVALLIGYRTRIATCLSWYLLVSLHSRNIHILGGGDALLRAMLFWSMFLNLGAAYSVDSALDSAPREKNTPILSPASAAILLQVCIVYWATAALKLQGDAWSTGRALRYALHFDYCAKPPAVWLRRHESLLPLLTHLTVCLQLLGPLLLFLPHGTAGVRCLVVFTFIAFHVATHFLFSIGIWPVVGVIVWTLFIPAAFWNVLAARLAASARTPPTVYYDGDCGFCLRMVSILRTLLLIPGAAVKPAQRDPGMYELMRRHNSWIVVGPDGRRHFKFDAFIQLCRWSPLTRPIAPLLSFKPLAALGKRVYECVAANRDRTGRLVALLKMRPLRTTASRPAALFCVLMLVYTLVDNAAAVHPGLARLYRRTPLPNVGLLLSMNQRWSLFAPDPRAVDYWFVIEGTCVSGRKISLFFDAGESPRWDKPDNIPAAFPSFRWHHYFANLAVPESPDRIRLHALAGYLARTWNTVHPPPDRVTRVAIHIVTERTGDTAIAPPERHILFTYPVSARRVQ